MYSRHQVLTLRAESVYAQGSARVPQGGALHDQQPAGTTAPDAPSYGVTWGGVPLHARRAMTVAVATLVAAGLAGPAAASAATTPRLVGRPGVGHRPRARRRRERARAGGRRRSVARSARQLDDHRRFHRPGPGRPDRRAARRRRRRSRSPRTPGSLCRAPTSSARRPRPARCTRSPTRSPAPRRCGTPATPARASTSR